MGIEPTRAPLPELENKWFRAMANPKCDGRVNFCGMWGHAGIREPTTVTSDVLGGCRPTCQSDNFRQSQIRVGVEPP